MGKNWLMALYSPNLPIFSKTFFIWHSAIYRFVFMTKRSLGEGITGTIHAVELWYVKKCLISQNYNTFLDQAHASHRQLMNWMICGNLSVSNNNFVHTCIKIGTNFMPVYKTTTYIYVWQQSLPHVESWPKGDKK